MRCPSNKLVNVLQVNATGTSSNQLQRNRFARPPSRHTGYSSGFCHLVTPAGPAKPAARSSLIPCRLQEITNIKVSFAMYCFLILLRTLLAVSRSNNLMTSMDARRSRYYQTGPELKPCMHLQPFTNEVLPWPADLIPVALQGICPVTLLQSSRTMS